MTDQSGKVASGEAKMASDQPKEYFWLQPILQDPDMGEVISIGRLIRTDDIVKCKQRIESNRETITVFSFDVFRAGVKVLDLTMKTRLLPAGDRAPSVLLPSTELVVRHHQLSLENYALYILLQDI